MDKAQCPICKDDSYVEMKRPTSRTHEYACGICGPFRITGTAEVLLQGGEPLRQLSAWIREQQEYGRTPPEISSDTIEKSLSNLPRYSPLDKQFLLLRAVERRTKYPGFEVPLNGWTDYPLAWANNEDELHYLLDALQERNFVKLSAVMSGPTRVIISTDGWQYLEERASKIAFLDRVFVAMSFREETNQTWEVGIKPAVEKAGYKPHRVDKAPHLDRIDAKIVSDIKDSRFLVAEVTGQNPGVYFEAGFALGLGRPVIWCVREDEVDHLHFDTRQYNHIVWKSPDDLSNQLYYSICANIGKLSAGDEEG
jgi:nucleoside 2-deoxyribosyltransferase